MEIVEATEFSEELHTAINELIPQLSSSAETVSESDLREILSNSGVKLLVAKEDHEYLGALCLVVFRIPTGSRACVEDVVVAEKARGRGIGKGLSKHALQLASQLGAKTVDLTSRPSRIAANELYKSIGFEIRNTNLYRYEVK